MAGCSVGRNLCCVAALGASGGSSLPSGKAPAQGLDIASHFANYTYLNITRALRRKEAAAAAAPPGRQARSTARQTDFFISQALEQVARAEEAHARAVGFLSLARQAHLFAALPLLQADVAANEQGVARATAEVAALMRELAGRRVAAVAAWRGKAAVLRRAVTRAMATSAAKEPRSWALGKGNV